MLIVLAFRWALPDPMAQAGFYHQPSSTGDDRAMCFTCNVCLVCWEPTDEPWYVQAFTTVLQAYKGYSEQLNTGLNDTT